MAKARPSRQPGLNARPPKRAEDQLSRRYAKINRRARRLLEGKTIEAVRAGNYVAAEREVERVQDTIDREFDDSWVREEAEKSGKLVSATTAVLFYQAVARSARIQIVGAPDSPIPPGRVFGSQGPKVVAKLNFQPQILIDGFVDQNVRLISTLRAGMVEAVGDQIAAAAVLGSTSGAVTGVAPVPLTQDQIARRLVEQWRKNGVPSLIPTRRRTKDGKMVPVHLESHAQLVARDQISKLNGQLNKVRQQSAGISKFIWRTQQDDRVRDSHEALEGRRFGWEEGADGIIPGEEINCRCWGQAVVDRDQVLRDGDWIRVGDDEVEGFSERSREGARQVDPGPGARLEPDGTLRGVRFREVRGRVPY